MSPSLQELADLMSEKFKTPISKSNINHLFRSIHARYLKGLTMTINKQLGYRIRFLRQQKGWTIEELSFEANINRNYLNDLERGARNPTLKILNRLALALQITLSILFEGIQEI